MIDFLRAHLDEGLFGEVAAALSGLQLPSLQEAADEIAALRAALEAEKHGRALSELFLAAGAADEAYFCDKFAGKARWGEDGELLNGGELVEMAKGQHPALFLLPKVEGVKPADVQPAAPFAAETPLAALTLTERLKLFQCDPAAYGRRRR